MKCRFTQHALDRMSRRSIKKETVINVIKHHTKTWISKKNKRHQIFALDSLRVIRDIHNGCVITVYEFGVREEWHK